MWFYIEKGKVNEWKCNSSDAAEALSCHPHNFLREINMLFLASQKLLLHLIYRQYKGRDGENQRQLFEVFHNENFKSFF